PQIASSKYAWNKNNRNEQPLADSEPPLNFTDKIEGFKFLQAAGAQYFTFICRAYRRGHVDFPDKEGMNYCYNTNKFPLATNMAVKAACSLNASACGSFLFAQGHHLLY